MPSNRQAICLIVLGGRVEADKPVGAFMLRIDTAEDFLRTNPDATAVATGGFCHTGQTVSEAQCVKNELVRRGIAANRILLEERAQTTYQNFEFSKKLIPAECGSVVIVTNKYHIRRAKIIARQHGIIADAVAAPNPRFPYYSYLREAVTMLEVAAKGVKIKLKEWLK